MAIVMPRWPFLRRVIDRFERPELRLALQRQDLGDRRCQGRLAMVDMANRPYVYVRLRPLKLLARQGSFLR
ncbi:MAG: hypothetical protein KatS3mg061_2824 [Dehalococcoidia bacterium]|nr:MAG: hypothetical protein KatS3mg061_2824 [Dehalococcoidia bacterium]